MSWLYVDNKTAYYAAVLKQLTNTIEQYFL